MEFFTSMTISAELILGLALPLLLLIAAVHQLWRPSSKKKDVNHQEKELLPLPPGQSGLPFFGETLEFLRTQKEGVPWKFIEDRISAYGETFKTNLLTCPTVVLASPSGNKAAFSNSHISWPYSVIAILGPKSLTGIAGPPATRIRNALMLFLRPESLQRYMSRVDLIFLSFIKEHFAGKSEVLFLFPLMKKLIFSIACEVFIGLQDGKDQESLLLDFDTMVKGMIEIPITIPGTRYSKALAAADALRKHLQVWIDKRRRDMAAGYVTEHQDILSGFLMYTDERGEPFSDEEIKDNILLLLFAGHDTSAIVVTMTCKYLALNPDIMDQVYRENKEIAASKAPDELLNWGDIQKMKLSWRVVQESMRLTPPSQGSFRVAQEDMSFDGFRIPKSWKIMWSPNSTHRNPKYFPDPEKFDPSRFEGAGPAPFTFVPFSGGARMCPGNEFARMEILMILHHLVTRFSWILKNPNEAIVVDPMPRPVKGLPILLTPRIP